MGFQVSEFITRSPEIPPYTHHPIIGNHPLRQKNYIIIAISRIIAIGSHPENLPISRIIAIGNHPSSIKTY